VLNKPAGIVVHPAAGTRRHTLVNALLHHCKGSLSGIGGVARPGIVHRLDKETSGCLVVAKNDERISRSRNNSRRAKFTRFITRSSVANRGAPPAKSARHRAASTHRKRMAVRDDSIGRAAHTSYEIIERLYATTLMAAQIHTGRTHQVRRAFPIHRPSARRRRN